MPKKWLNKKEVENAVVGSISLMEVMRKLGYTHIHGGSHDWLRKKVNEWKIDTSHFLKNGWNKGRKFPGNSRKRAASDILVYHPDGLRQRSLYLRRALDEIDRPYLCSGCGLGNWRGSKITLEVEHKDGDFQNDKEDNLEYLCPNCHSQTGTYKNTKRV